MRFASSTVEPVGQDLSKIVADHRVALSDIFLHKQGAVIEVLRRLGHDTTDAYALLIEFERMQARLLADRTQLRQDLEQVT